MIRTLRWYIKNSYNMWYPETGIKAVVRERGELESSVLSDLAKDSPIQNHQRKQEESKLWEENSRAISQART